MEVGVEERRRELEWKEHVEKGIDVEVCEGLCGEEGVEAGMHESYEGKVKRTGVEGICGEQKKMWR